MHAVTTLDEPPRPDPAAEPPVGAGPVRVPEPVRRRLAPFDGRRDWWSWLAAGGVTLIAAALRLVGLDEPKGKIFDEIYYATDAHSLLTRGVEWNTEQNTAAYVVHPPLGKWMIAVGEWVFGYDEFGWRISAAVIGIASVLMICRIGRRLFHSTVLGCAAGLLLAFDGMHFVLSRSALLDIFLMFFILAAFGCLLLDRDARRRRWLRELTNGLDPGRGGRAGRPAGLRSGGWVAAVPWWRLAAAAMAGAAMAVKWSAIFYIVIFAVLVLVWEAATRRTVGARHPWRDTLLDEGGWLVVALVVAAGVYLASWSGWFLTDDGYFRHRLADAGQTELPVLGALQNLLEYHLAALDFHTGLSTAHKYQSWPWQWLVLGRPVAFHWSGDGPCGADACASEVLLLGTPMLWWVFIPALLAMAWFGISRRDWRALALGAGVFAGIAPWFWYALDGRTMFYFYALPALPFLILSVVYVLGAVIRPHPTPHPPLVPERPLVGAIAAGIFVLLVIANFVYFHPIYTGEVIPYADWSARMWLGRLWI